MAVDVLTETTIDPPPEVVAAYVADPTNAPEWYVNIQSATPRTSRASSRSWNRTAPDRSRRRPATP